MLAPVARFLPRHAARVNFSRAVSSLSSNPRIKVLPADASRASFLLSYLEDEPPNKRIAIGFSTTDPPTPRSFIENQTFTKILYEVLAEHAHKDKDLLSQAQAFAGPGGANLGSGGVFFAQKNKSRSPSKVGSSGAGGASAQGGAGGGGHGGYVHLSDSRNPPDFGRIAWPEDILGSVEVDQSGNIIGQLEPSGTYRIITNEGILGLSPYLSGKLVERLRAEDEKDHS
ncbi:hypothetical protein CORC01_10670 [Colletotrichum orchidophilum]|uniref:Uncharacterized protein n=1 Tax=Colletotrichum orchidophilum TaxID=1209926 RepID=A0A1G4AXT7_9PEZI|nr:uncharacterized protein CORC01_10670 [Colletotrichum orchidophilum]OHE93978.1 hypothetical protein CORC01_10670 [Colletotrichum orchidophilum]